MSRYRIEPLQASHAVEAFDCRTLAAANIAGIRALAVHAKDERARGFYEHFGFRPSPSDPQHLFVLLKDLQAMTGK